MRRTDREVTDNRQIQSIIEQAKVVHIGMIDNDRPYVVPMQYGFVFADGQLTLYVHCAKEGRKLDIIKKNPRVFIELETEAAIISGGDIPCKYGSEYASVMGDGTVVVVEDVAEKIFGLQLLMKTQTGRDFDISEQMTKSVTVLRIDVPHVTAKSRTP
ncbi:pyridoxamine 5'-phosphate oxidase family protein [Treponema vincentii]|jgi:5-nitroimidazole antibiotic resistance protein|uniref:pyridoxamine 5'-phosphate oxidase family protein n=1 Tax=Treponema vincentii TaxID=69710 RepID=UPI0020A3B732|nr:pyridoxamine 5'-phosphate oxidase family protein [Treponema vincentii]UTC46333.1 pyridoxamine 5'-phosphate oxidase family protein [Treponema vincentii]